MCIRRIEHDVHKLAKPFVNDVSKVKQDLGFIFKECLRSPANFNK